MNPPLEVRKNKRLAEAAASATKSKIIWIDLDNSPHVPFFAPIIGEMKKRGYQITVTARDAYQTCELADFFGLTYRRVGRHYGKNRMLKVLGTCIRALKLFPVIAIDRPNLAVSHGSRSQLLISRMLGIPSVCMLDYEFVKTSRLVRPTWLMVPDVIPATSVHGDELKLLRYPGIKEDVYSPGFKPNSSIKAELNLDDDDVIVTVRPPAVEAHYHDPKSDELFEATIGLLSNAPNVKVIVMPRNPRQAASIRASWPELFSGDRFMIPPKALDGLNLIWHSDLVISGGGTMNREAAALGVPVYSIFRGKVGAVDQYLADSGRLVLLRTVEDVRTKISLSRRVCRRTEERLNSDALAAVTRHLISILDGNDPRLTSPQL